MREAAPPPIATTLFHLTPRGKDLLPVIGELGRWGAPLLAEAKEDDAFRSYWMTLLLELYYYEPTRICLRSLSRCARATNRWSSRPCRAKSGFAAAVRRIRTRF